METSPKPLNAEHISALKAKFGKTSLANPLYLGMTSYTIGALDNIYPGKWDDGCPCDGG